MKFLGNSIYAGNNIDINVSNESSQFLIYFAKGQEMKSGYV